MFKVLDALDKKRYQPRVYVAAITDHLAKTKVQHHESKWLAQCSTPSADHSQSQRERADDLAIHTQLDLGTGSVGFKRIPRSREVGQSWFTCALTTAWASLFSAKLLVQEQPHLILANGPGTCLPLCMLAWLLSRIRLLDCRVVFIESIARTEKLSMTGQILYHLRAASEFFVQWDTLAAKFPKARCVGRVY
jgi:beta-1,4-N-acetylglucosaminyltransferase